MLQKCACSIPDILWLLSPSGPTEMEAKLRESRNAAWPKYRTPSDGEGGRAIWNARGRGASFSLSSSLACKLFGMGKSSFSSLSTPFRSQSGLNSQGQGRHFGVLTRQRVTGLLPTSDSRGDNQRDLLVRNLSLISQTLFS